MNLPKFAISRKTLVLVGFSLFLFWSIASAVSMQRREDPGTVQRATEIVTVWPGASTHDVEQLVTKKIADEMRGVAHVYHVTGTSKPGVSAVSVELDDYVNDSSGAAALRDIRDHLGDVRSSLPAGIVGPQIVSHFWDTYPVVLGVTAEGYTPRQLRDLAKLLKDEISRLPDVGDVQMVGAQEQEVHVDLDARRLADYGIAPEQVSAAVTQANVLVPGGTSAISGRSVQISTDETLKAAHDVAETSIVTLGSRPVRIGDVADVKAAYPDPPDELVHVNGSEGIALAISAKATSSVTTLDPEINAYLAAQRSGWPSGVRVSFIADQPSTVSGRLRDFMFNLALGVLLAATLVALFMGVRNGLLVGTTIVLSVVLTFGVMPLFSIDIQQISIISLIVSIGMVVDAGIVAVDNIERLMSEGVSRFEAAWRGVSELWFPLLTSTLVGMSSFVPFMLLGGGVGNFVHDIGLVVGISLTMSLLVAYFITPILGEWFAQPRARESSATPRVMRVFDGLVERLRRAYTPLAAAALARPWLTAGIAVALVVAAVASIPALGSQFFPPADRNQFVIDVDAPEGTDIRTTEAIVKRVETLVAAQSGVTAFGSFIGHGAPKFYYNILPNAQSPAYAQLVVDTTDAAAANRIVDSLRPRVLREIPGARINVKKLEQGPPVGAPIQIRLTGDDPIALARASQTLQATLRKVPGTYSVRDSSGAPATKVALAVDEDRAALAGVDAASIRSIVALAYGGATPTAIREGDRETAVVVRFPEILRNDPSALAALPVRSSSGAQIPLAEVASIRPSSETSVSTLRDGQQTVMVEAEVSGRLPSAALSDFKRALGGVSLPAGVAMSYAGEDEQSTKSLQQLLVAMVVGLMINQLILVWEFRSLRLSLIVLGAVPLGLVGAVVGLAATGSPFGFTAALGIAGLGGVVTNHTIVLFEYARRELQHGMTLDEALVIAGKKRIRPILLTVVTSIAGLLPLALSGGGLWPPMCWAIIFGLAGSMVMTLVAIPAIYRLTAGAALMKAEPEAIAA